LIKKDKEIEKQFKLRLNLVLGKQTEEGWFYEYGGADIGYSSVLLHYLTDIEGNYHSKKIRDSIVRLCDFLKFFVNPDGTVGGEYGSRNTEYFLLKGLVSASRYSKVARQMIKRINWNLSNLDDRYLFHYIFYSYVEGFLGFTNGLDKKLNFETKSSDFKKYFKNSGLFVYKKKDIYFISNLKKGGVFKLYKKNKLIFQDAGYRVAIKNQSNMFLVNAWIDDTSKIFFDKDSGRISLNTCFYKNKYFVPTPIKHIVLRVVSFLFSSKLIPILKDFLILQDTKTDYLFKREFIIKDSQLEIIDYFDKHLIGKDIYSVRFGSMRYVPSSNFFNKESIGLNNTELKLSDKYMLRKVIKF
jgi:hypothetical protein